MVPSRKRFSDNVNPAFFKLTKKKKKNPQRSLTFVNMITRNWIKDKRISHAQEALELMLGSDIQGRNANVVYMALDPRILTPACSGGRIPRKLPNYFQTWLILPQNHSPTCRTKYKVQHFYMWTKAHYFLEWQIRLQPSVWELKYTCTHERHSLTFTKSNIKCLSVIYRELHPSLLCRFHKNCVQWNPLEPGDATTQLLRYFLIENKPQHQHLFYHQKWHHTKQQPFSVSATFTGAISSSSSTKYY